MKDNYDFSAGVKNPYIKESSKQDVALLLDTATVNYFKGLAEVSGIAYQTIMERYLTDCARQRREITIDAKHHREC
jgi:hypothetical protein